MQRVLIEFFPVSQKRPAERAGNHAAAVPPVVDSENQKSEDEKTHGPVSDLVENSPAKVAAPAFAVIQGRAHQAAQGRGCADGQWNVGKTGCPKPPIPLSI